MGTRTWGCLHGRCTLLERFSRTAQSWRLSSVTPATEKPGQEKESDKQGGTLTKECTTKRMRTKVKKRDASGARPTG